MTRSNFLPLSRPRAARVVALTVFLSAPVYVSVPAQGRAARSVGGGADGLAALHFRPLGPEGNRVASIIGEPGNSSVVYIGAANGGIWKTTDGGTNWAPIFDGEDVSAIGALAMAPSAHDVVWAGTGEPWLIRPVLHHSATASTNPATPGRTWQHMGLDQTGHIARIIVDPRDANNVWVCAIGQAFRQQKERGVFHTTDGGASWQHSLAVNDATGCSDLTMDPSDSRTLYAGMWQVEIHRWNLNSGGPASGVYVTRDGGATWSKLVRTWTARRGLSARQDRGGSRAEQSESRVRDGAGRTGPVSIAPTTREQTGHSSTRRTRSPNVRRITRGSPSHPTIQNLLYFPSVSFTMSRDGGTTVFQPGRGGGGGAAAGAAAVVAEAGEAVPALRQARDCRRRAATTTMSGSTLRTRIACSSPTTPA